MNRKFAWLFVLSLISTFVVAGCGGKGDQGTAAPTSGSITGTVTDAVKGDPLAGVTVTAKDSSTTPVTLAATTTDATGHYVLAGVPIGPVSVYFAKTFYTAPPGMTVSVLGGITVTINAAMSEAASGGPSVTLAAAAPYDDYGYGGSALVVAAATDPNDNGTLLKYTWSNETALLPKLGTVTVNPADNTQATVGFPTIPQAMGPRTDNTNPNGDTWGYAIPARFGILPVLTDTRGTVTAQVKVDDRRGRTAAVKISLNAASLVTGARNVPLNTRIYLNAGHDNAVAWSFTPPGGSAAALSSASDRYAFFVPDVSGPYLLSEGANTMTIYSGAWKGVITGTSGGDTIVLDAYCTNCHNDVAAVDEFTPWAATGHATMFTRGIDGGNGTSYGASCISCHTVGYDKGVANGGFDDLMAQYAWTFPATLTATNWASMFPAFENVARLANIQCENCHGPNTSDAHQLSFDNTAGRIDPFASPRISFSAEVCATCHASGSGHHLYSEWAASGHANLELAEGEGTSTSCGRCHGAQGFTVFLDLIAAGNVGAINNLQAPFQVSWSSVTANNVQPQTCTACHDPHDDTNPNQLRLYDNVPLTLAGYGISGFGKGAACVLCHSEGRSGTLDNTHTFLHEDNATGGLAPQTTSPPHVSAITDILVGRNVYFMGANLPMYSKHTAVGDVCVGCHMTLNPKTHLSHGNPVNNTHLFSIEDADRATLCANCHGAGVNGDAIIAAVQSGLDALEAKMNSDMLARLQGYGATLINVGTDNVAGNRFSAVAFQKNLTTSRPPGSSFKLYYDNNASSATLNLDNIKLTSGGTKIFPVSSNMMKAIWNYGMIFAGGSGGKAIHNPSFELLVLSNTRAQNLGN